MYHSISITISRMNFRHKFTSINPSCVRNRTIQVYNRPIAVANLCSDGYHLLTSITAVSAFAGSMNKTINMFAIVLILES